MIKRSGRRLEVSFLAPEVPATPLPSPLSSSRIPQRNTDLYFRFFFVSLPPAGGEGNMQGRSPSWH